MLKNQIKTILFLSLLISTFGCNIVTNDSLSSRNAKNDSIYKLKHNESSLIIVDKSKLGDANQVSTWTQANDGFILKNYSFDPNVIAVDLNLMSEDGDETNNATDIAKWLKENNNYINFKDSFEFIEKSHVVLDQAKISDIKNKEIEIEINSIVKKSITLNEIINEINRQAGLFNPALTFNDLFYPYYINFTLKKTPLNVSFKVKNGYSTNDVSFSVSALKSIISHNGINPADLDKYNITFSYDEKIPYNSLNDQIAFKIFSKINGTEKYYNYSTDPTKKLSVKSVRFYNSY